MLRLSSVALALALFSVASAPSGYAAEIKANKPGQSKISTGGCCAKVGGACISKCTKNGGCTGNGDCTVIKAN
jgi:hypothetical protein